VNDDPVRERAIRELAGRISELGGRQRARAFHLSWWSDRLLARAMADPVFRTRLFRFVDAFPAMIGDEDVEDHLLAEFEGLELPGWFGTGLGLTRSVPGGARISAAVARRGIDRMARQFVIGTDPLEVAESAGDLWRRHTATTVDILGEHTHSESEADGYAARLAQAVEALGVASRTWPTDDLLEFDDLGAVPRASVSVKATALASVFTPLSASEALESAAHRLLPILRRATDLGVSVWFDMESYEEKELTHLLLRRVLSVPGLERLHAGVVVQAYLRDSLQDLEELAAWARGRRTPLAVRLVKGAYWDSETVDAAAKGWECPVFAHKSETDWNYERLARVLLGNRGNLRAAFATHNLRSLAAAVVDARSMGVPDNAYEIQLLYGMAEPLHEAIRRSGFRLRIYAPVGELVPGMAYLVRRLLENTSNESFVRHHFAEGEDLEELLAPPSPRDLPGPASQTRRAPTDPAAPGPYRPEPPAEWRRREVRDTFAAAIDAEFRRQTRQVPAMLAGQVPRTIGRIKSVDPANPLDVVSEAASCEKAEVDAAVEAAVAAAVDWGQVEPVERVAVLFRAAENMRARRADLAALEVRETGKGWADADADVCEAIDYCEYYGRRMLEMAAGADVDSPPGEDNRLVYRPRGVCAVISPWNFPLAIPAGMTSAALVTGNCVILKPAEQAPAVAAELVKVFAESGLPEGVLSFLPGTGEEAGAPLVSHPRVDIVAFTGSRDVGLAILEASAQRREGRRSVARVIAEMGGKNAIVVDSDADLDEVVPAVIQSAFGFAGQKCSAAGRLIAVSSAHDAVVERVLEAAKSIVIGPPRTPGTQLGPVIDPESRDRLRSVISRAAEAGTVRQLRSEVPAEGWFLGPVIVTDVDPDSWLANEELFGPVLATFRAGDFGAALELANRGEYALTAGVFSRSAEHIRLATRTLKAGNVYVNRAITGAVVGRQPFGGNAMSGIGYKAGGPDYLLQFCDTQVVCENTLRQGFVPEPLEFPARAPRSESGSDGGPPGAEAAIDPRGGEPSGEPSPGKQPTGSQQGAA